MLLSPLQIDYAKVGVRIEPRWLGPADLPWIEQILAGIYALDGVSEASARQIVASEFVPFGMRHGRTRRAVSALVAVERQRWTTTVRAGASPEALRSLVFERAAEGSKQEALAAATARFGITEDEVVNSLFADRLSARILVAPARRTTAAELVARYDTVLLKSLLARATELEVYAADDPLALAREAKRRGLLASVERRPHGPLAISGPLALFHRTTKYAHRLSSFVDVLARTAHWSVAAEVCLTDVSGRFEMQGSGLPFDVEREAAVVDPMVDQLRRGLLRHAPEWRVETEVAPFFVGSRWVFVDLAIETGARRVLVDVLRAGSDLTVAKHLEDLAAIANEHGAPVLVLVPGRFAVQAEAMGLAVVALARRMDARSVIRCVESVAASSLLPSSRSSSTARRMPCPTGVR